MLWRWLAFGWVGRLGWLAATLYAFSWACANIGLDSLARQLGSMALFVLALLLTGLFVRLIWRNYTAPPRR